MTESRQPNSTLDIAEILEQIAEMALYNRNKGVDAFETALKGYSHTLAETIINHLNQKETQNEK